MARLPTEADMCPAGMALPLGRPLPDNPTVFMDVTVDGKPAGRLIFELRADRLPKTCRNFMLLAGDTMGFGYTSTKMHRIIPKSFCQGGDVLLGVATDGTGNLSAIGKSGAAFADECFDYKHAARGVLGMGNAGEAHSNQSQFYITFGPTRWLDGHCVVLGQLLRGWSVLDAIEAVGHSPSGRPKSDVMISGAGVLNEGTHPVGESNVQLYQLLGDADSLSGGIENDPALLGLQALTVERVQQLESSHHDAVLEERLMRRHAKLYGQMQDELDLANGRYWAASVLEMIVGSVMNAGADDREKLSVSEVQTINRAVYSDRLRRWPTLRQHAAMMSSLRAAGKAISKPVSIARLRAAALESVGSKVVDDWLEERVPLAPGSRRVSPRVEPTEVQVVEETYHNLLPQLDELSAAKQAARLSTGAKQWAKTRQLLCSDMEIRLGPDERLVDADAAASVMEATAKAATTRCETARTSAQPAYEARKKLAELRVRQELQQTFDSASPNADSADAKRVQMELEVLELRGLVSCGALAKAMTTVAANVVATCVSASPWNKNAPTDGEQGDLYAARHTDVLSMHVPAHILKAEAALQQALCEGGPHYAYKEISRRAKKCKIAATAALSLLDKLQSVNPNRMPDAVLAAYSEADEVAAKAESELTAARKPRSKWQHAKTKLLGAQVMHRVAKLADGKKTAVWVKDMVRNAKVEKEMHEDKLADSVEDQLAWGRAKHRLYRACGERDLLNDISSSMFLQSKTEQVIPTPLQWIATCDHMRAVMTNQLADAQTRLDVIANIRSRFRAGRSNIAATEAHLKSQIVAAKGRVAVRISVSKVKAAAQECKTKQQGPDAKRVAQAAMDVKNAALAQSILTMLQERALWADTLYSKMALLSCRQGRIKADKIIKHRREGAVVAKETAHIGMISSIVPEFGMTGIRQPWGLSVTTPALERKQRAMQEAREYQDLLLQRMEASVRWRTHKKVVSWLSRYPKLFGDEIQRVYTVAQQAEAGKMSRVSEDLVEMSLIWVDIADAQGILQAVTLSEIVFLRMSIVDQVNRSDLLLNNPVGDILTQMAAQVLRRLELAIVSSLDNLKEFKEDRQQLASAIGVTECSYAYCAIRAEAMATTSKESRLVRKLVADAATEVERRAWHPSAAAGAIVHHGTTRRRLLLLEAAIGAANTVMPIIETAITNRDVALDLIARSTELTKKTRETIDMPESELKVAAADALNEEAKSLAHTIRNLQTPSTAQHVVEELKQMRSGAESRRRKSDAKQASIEREAAEANLQLILLKSEERRCRAAAIAFPEMVKELLKGLDAPKVVELETSRLRPSFMQKVQEGFEETANEVAAAVRRAEDSVELLQNIINDSLKSDAYRREITGFHAHAAYFLERARRMHVPTTSQTRCETSPSDNIDPDSENVPGLSVIRLVNGLSTRVPRGSRLRPYYEYP